MKTLFKITFIIAGFILHACNEKEPLPADKWVVIDSLTPDATTSLELDVIFCRENRCLLEFRKKTIFRVFLKNNDLSIIDSCNPIPQIDFSKSSLVVGEIITPSISYKIDSLKFLKNPFQRKYQMEVYMDTCEYCWSEMDYKFFRRIFPALNSNYDYSMKIVKY
jgi:hypothetical protein